MKEEKATLAEVQYIEKLFPSIKELSDPDLRQKVIQAWVNLWHRGNFAKIEDSSWDEEAAVKWNIDWPNYQHVEQVTRVCIAAGKAVKEYMGIDVNMDYLTAAALLHDCDKLVMYDGKTKKWTKEGKAVPHGFWSAMEAVNVGMPTEVVHMVSAHTRYSTKRPDSIEAVILHQVDFLACDVRLLAEGEHDQLVIEVNPRFAKFWTK